MVIIPALLLAFVQVQAPPPEAPVTFGSSGDSIRYVVLGDSTAAGVGAAYEDGIAMQTARHLGLNAVVTLHNFGVSGARMRDVFETQLPRAETLAPDLVLISVGANDVTHLTSIPSMRKRLREISARLRAASPRVRIVITGAPDMGSPPRVPWALRGLASLRTKMVNRMFRAEAQRMDLVFAPIAEQTGPLFRRDRTLFHPDRFHPNARGYATWVRVLNTALERARASGASGQLLRRTIEELRDSFPSELLALHDRAERGLELMPPALVAAGAAVRGGDRVQGLFVADRVQRGQERRG
jgi:lysophospholipase L1-like esterase